jgi:hypothetical protein
MKQEEKIKLINEVVRSFFQVNKDIEKVLAKDLMPQFIKAGIFEKDHRNGLPIRQLLRDLDEIKAVDKITAIQPERKKVNTNWYFVNIKVMCHFKTTDQCLIS